MTRLYRRLTGRARELRRGAVRRQEAHHAGQSGERDERARPPLPSPVDERLAHPRLHLARHAGARSRRSSRRFRSTAPMCRRAAPARDDRRYIDWAIALAKKRWRPGDTTILDFIHGVLIADLPGHSRPEDVLRTAMQFQQVTGPVMAKAFEDTAFYRYFRLLALNEVGGDPRRFGMSCAAFHHVTAERARLWPRAMLTTATHDTKRGEDARLRIALLSEMPREWGRRVAALAAASTGAIAARSTASRCPTAMSNTCSIRCWSAPGRRGSIRPMPRRVGRLAERVEAAMVKSVREGKERSSWSYPNAAYEAGLQRFVRGVLDAGRPNPFLADFAAFVGVAGAPGRDRLAGAARAEADRAGRARHLPGRRTVGFQPGRSRQPPPGRLGRTPAAARRDRRRAPCRTGRSIGRTGARSCS